MGTTLRALDLLAGLDEAICATDSAGTVIFWNEAAEKLYGIPAQRAVGVPIEDLFTVTRGEETFDSTWRELLAHGRFQSDVVQLTHSGEELPVRSTIRPLKLHNGDSAGLLVVAASADAARTSAARTNAARANAARANATNDFPHLVGHAEARGPFAWGEHRLARLAEATFEGIGVSVAGIVLDVNQQLADMLGYDRYEMIGMSVLEMVAPEDRNRAIEAIRLGSSSTHEYHAVRKDGSRFPVEVRGRALLHEGEPVRLTAVRDISDRKRSERALRDSERMLRSILNASMDAIGVAKDGVIVFANRPLAVMFGYETDGDVLGRPILDLFAPSEHESVRILMNEPISGSSASGARTTRGLRKGGSEFDLEIVASRFALGGEPHGITVMRESTDTHERDKALRESECRLRTVIENAREGIVMADGHGKIIAWNKEQERIAGFGASEVIGLPVWDVLVRLFPDLDRPETLERLKAQVLEFARTGRAAWAEKPMERELARPDGTRIFVRGTCSAIPTASGLLQLLTVHDITATRRTEEEKEKLTGQLRQAQKMESIGRLAGGVAHDFNNILTTIGANAELAFMELRSNPGSNEALNECLREIRRAVGTASSLTRQLLAFSRKQVIEPVICDLNELVARMHNILARVIGEDIELRTIPAKPLDVVRADRSQIEQILLNLVVNARDAMPDGGKLTIQTANIDLDDRECLGHPDAVPGRYVMLTVTDTGCGIAPDVLAHVFEPFFTTKDRDKGTGLGLATVYGAVKQHEGFVEVDSEVGRGTSFRIYLPRTETSGAASAEARATAPPAFGRGIVVLVEDDPLVRKVAVTLLLRLGYEVISYEGGPSAIDGLRACSRRIDLLITDVVMPGLSGIELARQVAELRPGTKVLFTSGYAENGVSDGIGKGTYQFLPKPYTLASLSKKVQEVLATSIESEEP